MKSSFRIVVGTATLAGMLFAGAPGASAGTITTIEGNQLMGAVSGFTTAAKAYLECVI